MPTARYALVLSCAASAACPVCAQPAVDRPEEIVVTAQRRSEYIRDVPLSISAATGQELLDAGVKDLGDLGMLAPGLSVDEAAGYLLIHLRGVGSISTGAGVENAVALYIDGVYHANQSIGAARFSNVERVEILKGPQGTLFGRNATGGLIHIITEDPDSTVRLRGSLAYGNYNAVEGRFHASGPIGADLAADIAVRFDRHDGYGKNLANGREVLEVRHDVGIRSKLIYRPGPFRLTLVADYSDKLDSSGALPIVEGSRVFASTPPVDYPDRWDVRHDRQPRLRTRTGGVSAKGEATLGGVEITDILAYRRASLDDVFDFDGSEFPLVAAHIRQEDRQFSNELQLSSARSGPFSWIAGLYYFRARSRLDPQTVDLSPDPTFNPDLPLVALVTAGSQDTRSISIYGQGELKLGERTRVTGGARFTSERRSMDSKVDGVLLAPGDPVVPVTPRTRASKRFSQPTFRIAVDLRPSSQAMLFASVSTGFKSGGFNVAQPDSPFFRSERLTSYEAGGKWTLPGGRLRINASLFHYDYRRLQVLRAAQTSTGFSTGPSARITGFEAEAKIVPASGLELTAGIALLDARYGRFPDALLGSPGGGVPVVVGDASRNRVPFSPKAAFNLAASYVRPVGPGRLILNGTYLHSSRVRFEPDNVVEQKPYGLLNAMGRYEFGGGERWLSVYGRNLTNQAVTRAALTIPSGQQINILHLPRTFGVEFGVRY